MTHSVAPQVETGRVRTLEGIDRLFAVAHGEHRPGFRPTSLAGEELGRQCTRDGPLLARRVLHLVQQEVVEPAIQLEHHPGGTRIDQERPGPGDQVVVVQQARALLAVFEPGQDGSCEGQQGVRRGGNAQGTAVILDRGHAFRFGNAGGERLRLGLRKARVAERAGLPGLAVPGQEQARPLAPVFRAEVLRQVQPPEHPFGLLADGGRAMRLDRLHSFDQPRIANRRSVPNQRCVVARHTGGTLQPCQTGRCGQGEQRSQRRRVRTQLGHQPAEAGVGHQPRRGRERRRVGGCHCSLPRQGQFGVPVRLLQQAEMRRERGLEREATEQRLAESMDGADPHAARQVQHPREQGLRGCDHCLGRRHTQQFEVCCQLLTSERHPYAQDALEPQRHLGSSGFGEGQAKDARRVGPRQHQPQQALDEQLGLARPRGCRHESRYTWVGGFPLTGLGPGRRLMAAREHGRVHGPSSSNAAHSATRASWV